MSERGPKPEIQKKVIVEIGSSGIPASNKRGIGDDEQYISINEDKMRSRTEKFVQEYKKVDNFHPTVADALHLPFTENTVDELIYNNVFGDPRSDKVKDYLKEASRVLKKGGTIVITETITPGLNKLGVKHVSGGNYKVAPEKFTAFNLVVEKLSSDAKEIEQYRSIDFDPRSILPFQLVLKKI